MSGHFFLYVLFNEFPRIDTSVLRQAVAGLEPDACSNCEVSDFIMRATEEGSMYSGVVSCGDLNVAVQVYGQPLSEVSRQATIEVVAIAEAERERLRRHKVHARLTCLGGDDEFQPVENMVILWKVAMGLVAQGGIAVVNENNCTCVPSELVSAYAQQARDEVASTGSWQGPERQASFWNMMRNQGVPGELLVGFLTAEIGGDIWFLSAGHTLFGLPELVCRGKDPHELERVEEHFKTIFQYLFENGPVVRAGQSLNFDGTAGYKFSALPANLRNLEAAHGTLVVTIDEGEMTDDDDPLRDWDF